MIKQTKLWVLVTASILKPNPKYRMSESKAETFMAPEVNVVLLDNCNKTMAL